MTVVHDSGIWISAIQFGAVPRQAILRTIASDQLAISDLIEAEIYRTMQGKFGSARQEIQRAMAVLLENALRVTITHTVRDICRDPKDDHVLECAVKSRASLIVSGDKDLLTLREWKGIRMVTARQYVHGAHLPPAH